MFMKYLFPKANMFLFQGFLSRATTRAGKIRVANKSNITLSKINKPYLPPLAPGDLSMGTAMAIRVASAILVSS